MGRKQKSGPAPTEELRRRIESYLAEGRQCSECLLLALKDLVGTHNELLTRATRTLGKGMGGSGGVCGALTAGMLALGMSDQRDLGDSTIAGITAGYGRLAAPRNDFLDTYAPVEPRVFIQCRELADRFSQEVVPTAGSVNCRDISGVEWSLPTREALSHYYAPGEGMSNCIDLISRTAKIVTELVQRRESQVV